MAQETRCQCRQGIDRRLRGRYIATVAVGGRKNAASLVARRKKVPNERDGVQRRINCVRRNQGAVKIYGRQRKIVASLAVSPKELPNISPSSIASVEPP